MGMIIGYIAALIIVGGGAFWAGEQHGSETAMMHDQMMADSSSTHMMATSTNGDMMEGSSTEGMMATSSGDHVMHETN